MSEPADTQPVEQPAPAPPPTVTNERPTAVLRPQRRWTWLWLVPICAALLVLGLLYQSWSQRTVLIAIEFKDGRGLKAGDALRYRGIVIGRVRSVVASPDLTAVRVELDLQPDARRVASAGSRFWIVRPQVELAGIHGLETLLGAKYLAVAPGDGPRQAEFVGLEVAPVLEDIDPDGLEIVLQARRKGSLRPGAPIRYRQLVVGSVLSVGLASDASAIEARAYIRPAFTQLVRQDTVFWDSGGISVQAGLTGLALNIDSVEALLAGGVSLAVPNEYRDLVNSGHRFVVQDKQQEEWSKWSPSVTLGSHLLPAKAVMPNPLRATLTWKHEGRIFSSNRLLQGWVTRVGDGLVGPIDLLSTPANASEKGVRLSVAGEVLMSTSDNEYAWKEHGIALLRCQPPGDVFEGTIRRNVPTVEDALVVADRSQPPRSIAAARFSRHDEGVWKIDPALPFEPDWHGAAVLAVSDGAWIGVLLVQESGAFVALIP